MALLKSTSSVRTAFALEQSKVRFVETVRAVTASFSAGDYDKARELTEGLRDNGETTPGYCFYRGNVQLQRANWPRPRRG